MQPKRIIITLLVVILALCSAVTIVSAEDSTTLDMAVEVSSSTALSDNALFLVEEGAIVTVSVAINSNPGVAYLHFDLLYNPAVLTPVLKSDNKTVDWTKGTAYTAATETVTKNDTTGKLSYTAQNPGVNMSGTGKIFSCSFKVIGHGSSPITFSMDGKDIATKDFDSFPVEAVTTTLNGAPVNMRTVLVHNYGSSVTKVPATCTEGGKNVYTCTVCKKTTTVENEDDPAKGHTEISIPSVTPTCKTPGKTEGIKCSACNLVITQQFDIPAGEKYHVTEVDAAVAPTCQADGLTEGAHCSVCDKVLTEQTAVPKLADHEYGDWVNNGDGTQTKKCVHCDESVTESISGSDTLVVVLIVVIVVLAVLLIGGGVVLAIVLVKRKKVV